MIRREPTYLSTDVWRACLMLAKLQTTESRPWTADEIADSILRQYVEMKYPKIFEHQKQISKLESELIKTLNDNPNANK